MNLSGIVFIRNIMSVFVEEVKRQPIMFLLTILNRRALPGNDKRRMSLRMNMDQKLGHIGYALLIVKWGDMLRQIYTEWYNLDPTQLVYELNLMKQKIVAN